MKSFIKYLNENTIKNKEGTEYEVSHTRGVNNEHHFHVHHQGKEIGDVRMSHTGKYVVDLHIHKDHRRKGLASALYNHIENHIGHKLEPSPVHQTGDGQAFWKSRK